MNTVKQPEE